MKNLVPYLVLVSFPAPFLHAQEGVWSKGSHFLVLEVCIVRSNQVAEKNIIVT